MRVLDLCAGTGSATAAFKRRGHEVVTVDNDEQFDVTHHRDVLQLTPRDIRKWGPFDFAWGGPLCRSFSRAGLPAHHIVKTKNGFKPATAQGRYDWKLAIKTHELCKSTGAPYIIENPRSLMHLGPLRGVPFVSVTYCQYGGPSMKRTTLMSHRFPPGWIPREECGYGDPCHPRTPRGCRSHGIQALDTIERGRVPYALSLDICKALERSN